ncbi:MAG: hypothetical protein IJW93_01255 [Clostridia bacterium]|nr:hypothetical protein [Clostridia bacterium]
MNKSTTSIIAKYFAAANTYRGFKSYFDRVFSSDDYDRIYVLKGGPGTGKSSFMKKASTFLYERECVIEEIYCSSDPNSLDGVIAKFGNKKIAILDGTAPHERDAVIPGAIDEIINLGHGWDTSWLTARKKEVLDIAEEKTLAYKAAYSYLSLAGNAYDLILNAYKTNFDETRAKITAELIINNMSISDSKIETRLISSFGKQGSGRLDTLSKIQGEHIKVCGDEISASLFLSVCKNILESKNIGFTHFPCALDQSATDAIYIPEASLVIDRDTEGEINADEFISLPTLETERIKKARQLWQDSLDEAKRWFVIASDLHFRLEKIYGEAMNFKVIDQIFGSTLTEIVNILEKDT